MMGSTEKKVDHHSNQPNEYSLNYMLLGYFRDGLGRLEQYLASPLRDLDPNCTYQEFYVKLEGWYLKNNSNRLYPLSNSIGEWKRNLRKEVWEAHKNFPKVSNFLKKSGNIIYEFISMAGDNGRGREASPFEIYDPSQARFLASSSGEKVVETLDLEQYNNFFKGVLKVFFDDKDYEKKVMDDVKNNYFLKQQRSGYQNVNWQNWNFERDNSCGHGNNL